MLIVSLALFLTWFVMEPVLIEAWANGIEPMIAGTLGLEDGFMSARSNPSGLHVGPDWPPTRSKRSPPCAPKSP